MAGVGGNIPRADMPQRHRPCPRVAARQHQETGRGGKARRDPEFLPIGQQEHPVAHLGNAVEGAVDQRIARGVAKRVQRLHHLLGHVAMAVVQDIRHVLDQQRQGTQRGHPGEIAQVQVTARIGLVGSRIAGDLAQLGPSNPCIGLTGRPAHEHVDGLQAQFFQQGVGVGLGDVARDPMLLLVLGFSWSWGLS